MTTGAAILDIKVATSGWKREFEIGLPRRVKAKDLAVFARQFAVMNNAGVSIPRSLAVLARAKDAGLVTKERQGRERIVRGNPERVARARDLLAQLEGLWRARLGRLDGVLANPNPQV